MTPSPRRQRPPSLIKVILLGDILGRPGRTAVAAHLPRLRAEHQAELVIANVENLAGGKGVSARTLRELEEAGVDVFTSGNHVWENPEAAGLLANRPHLLRPANFPRRNPGRGFGVFPGRTGKLVGVINLTGRIFMDPMLVAASPFDVVEEAMAVVSRETHVIIVDIHAEATSEKQALGWYLNSRVSAVIGTHTHVATADERLLPGGTAYLSDAGMTGVVDSVIGIRKQDAIARFLTGMPRRLELARTGRREVQGVVVEINSNNGRAVSIERLQEVAEL